MLINIQNTLKSLKFKNIMSKNIGPEFTENFRTSYQTKD